MKDGMKTFSGRDIKTGIEIDELSLEDLRKFHKRKMLEMFELVQSLMEQKEAFLQDKNGYGQSLLWISPENYIRFYTSISELRERIRILSNENSELRDLSIREDVVLQSRAMRAYDEIAHELATHRDKISSLKDTLSLFNQEDIDAKKIGKVREEAMNYGLMIADDTAYVTRLIKAWEDGGLNAVHAEIMLTLNNKSEG